MSRCLTAIALLAICGTALAQREAAPVPAEVVLSRARQAFGSVGLFSKGVLRASGHESTGGLSGQWTSSSELSSGRYAQRTDFGAYAIGKTFDGSVVWKVDRSGGVHALDGDFSRRNGVTDGWLAQRGYLKADLSDVRLASERRVAEKGRSFDVLMATPHGGEPVQLWFDAVTHLLAKDVRREPIRTVTETFESYREVRGVELPFQILSTSDYEPGSDEIAIERYDLDLGTHPLEFAQPKNRDDATLGKPTRVATDVGRYVAIKALLNGAGPFSFIFDTGGHNIITPAVAAELGLTSVGAVQAGGAGAGTLTEGNVTVASLQVGDARLSNQHFYVIPLQYSTVERGKDAPLAGILGLEMLERFAVRIDYRKGELTLVPFMQAAAFCSGQKIPIRFDDDMPLADGMIDGKAGVLAVDSGNGGSTVVQGVWASNVGLGARLRAGIATTSFGSGGASANWITRGGELTLGLVKVAGIDLRLASDRQGAFSSITEAGNVGQQVLARFSVLFDYRRGVMCLAPVDGYTPPPLDRSGMVLTKVDQDHFAVASVNSNSPASAADIRPGDMVTVLDGSAASDLSGEDVYRLLRGTPGTIIKLKLTRNQQIIDRVLTLAEPHL